MGLLVGLFVKRLKESAVADFCVATIPLPYKGRGEGRVAVYHRYSPAERCVRRESQRFAGQLPELRHGCEIHKRE